MAAEMVRFTLTIPNEMIRRAEKLKQTVFFNKPYSEMYRQLIRIGMEKLQAEEYEPDEKEE